MDVSQKMTFSQNRNLEYDVIRGIAVLGMIFINILVFIPNINEITWHDSVTGELTSDGEIYRVIYLMFHGKMRALFALLFGAGIILFFNSKTQISINKSDYFSRRMLWLLLFGLAHAYILLWPGSILFEYALCGLLLFSLRNLKSKTLLLLSCSVLAFYIYLYSKDFSTSLETYKGYEKALQLEKAKQLVPDDLVKKKLQFEGYLENCPPLTNSKKEQLEAHKQENIKIYTSGLSSIFKQNINTSNESLSLGVYLNILESIGTMLLGMALLQLGFFNLKLKKYIYYLLIFIGIPLGLYLYLLLYNWQGLTKNELLEIYTWKTFSSFTVEGIARIILSLGYCSLLILLCSIRFIKPSLMLIGNVGRMAFSNYVIQTLICVIFFYAMKLYGRFNIAELTIFSIGVILFQLIESYYCIKIFNSGPIEFYWRKLSKSNLPGTDSNNS